MVFEWESAGIGAAIITAVSGYVILKARLGHDQRVSAEGALIASGPAIISALNVALANRDARIDKLETRNSELWQMFEAQGRATADCEVRCLKLQRDVATALQRIASLERNNGHGTTIC